MVRAFRGGDSHMEWTGMLVVSLRGVNFGFWSRLGCSGQNVIIFNRQGLVKGCTRRKNKTERILILYIYSIHINKFAIIKSHEHMHAVTSISLEVTRSPYRFEVYMTSVKLDVF